MSEVIKHQILRENVGRFNPFITDMPSEGNNMFVLRILANTFVAQGCIFSGSIEQVVQVAKANNITEKVIENGFADLEKYGYLTLEDDVFTPTEQLLEKFS